VILITVFSTPSLRGHQIAYLEMRVILGKLVDRMDQKKLITIKTFGQNFTNSPSDKFLLMILCSQAKARERQQKYQCEAWS
jgi:hypothetical protein